VFTLLKTICCRRRTSCDASARSNHATGNPVDTAVFFGLSGIRQDYLSADTGRTPIGDDEHGLVDNGILQL